MAYSEYCKLRILYLRRQGYGLAGITRLLQAERLILYIICITHTSKLTMLCQSVLRRDLSDFCLAFFKRFFKTHKHFASALLNHLIKNESKTGTFFVCYCIR